MALTYTAGTSVEGTASVTSTTVTLPTQVAGDYCFIVVSLNAASGIITTPTGWTNILASTASVNGSTSDILAIFYRKWVSGDASTVAIATTSGRVAATPVKVSGADGTTFINTAAAVTQAASGAATVSSPSITPTSTGLVIVLNSRNNTSGAFVTPWTGLTAGITEIAEASGKATAANNAGHLIGQATVTSGTATGTKAATPTGTATGGMGVAFAINPVLSQNFSAGVPLSGAGTLGIAGTPGISGQTILNGAGSLAVGGPPALSAAVPLSGSGSLGIGAASGLPPAVVSASTQIDHPASATSYTSNIPAPAGIVAGNLLVAFIYQAGGSQSWTPPAGWTQISQTTSGSNTGQMTAFWKVATSSEPASYPFAMSQASANSIDLAESIVQVSGIPTAAPVDVTGSAQQTTAGITLTAPSVAATGADLLLTAFGSYNGRTFTTPPSGMTTAANIASSGVSSLTVTSANLGGAGATPVEAQTLGSTDTGTAYTLALYPASYGVAVSAAVGLSGSGTLSGSGVATSVATVGLSGSGSLGISAGPPRINGAAALSGSGTLSLGPTGVATSATVGLSGAGTLSGVGAQAVAGSAALSGAGTLATTGAIRAVATVALGGSGSLAIGGAPGQAGAVTLSGSGVLSGVGSGGTILGTIALSGSGSLTINPGALSISGGVALSGAGNLTTSAIVGFARSVGLSGVGVLSAAGRPNASSSVILGGDGALVVTVTQASVATVNLGGDGNLYTRPPIVLLPPQIMLIGVLGTFPLERFQRNGATAGQITSLQSTWGSHDSTWQAEMAEALAQAPDSWVLQQITLGLSGPIPASVTAGWPFGQ